MTAIMSTSVQEHNSIPLQHASETDQVMPHGQRDPEQQLSNDASAGQRRKRMLSLLGSSLLQLPIWGNEPPAAKCIRQTLH